MHADDERLFPIYEKCEKHHIPFILQYGGGINSVEYYDPSDIYRLAEAFPDLKICITHGGWPQVMPMIHQAYAHKNVYLSPDALINESKLLTVARIAATAKNWKQVLMKSKFIFPDKTTWGFV